MGASISQSPGIDATRPEWAALSWLDRLQTAIDSLAMPWWLPYFAFWALVQVAGHAARWADGSLAAGTLDLTRNPMYGAFYPAFLMAAMHYLDREAHRRLDTFASAVALPDPERTVAAHRLTTLPARPVAWITVAAAVPATVLYLIGSGVLAGIESSAPVIAVNVILIGVALVSLVLFVYHALHQLIAVVWLHDVAPRIDPFSASTLYVFSGLAARTGLIIIAVAWYGLFVRPDLVLDAGPVAVGLAGAVLASGVAAAVIPLLGIHQRLVSERSAWQQRADARVRTLVERSWASDAGLPDDGFKDELAVAMEVRRIVATLPTWPWRAGAIAAFGSTVVLPVLVWAVTQIADRAFFR